MLDPVVPFLRCPICRDRLAAAPGALRCAAGHGFDVARQGYVDLTGGRTAHAGDSAGMLDARAAVLDAGHFRPLADMIVTAAAASPGLLVDAGAGTGYYLAALLDARPADLGLALDVAKPALRRAARAHHRLAAVRADIWRGLPVADGVAAVVLNVFAPRSGAEFRRILRPDGLLVVATPTGAHLRELPGLLDVDPAKERRLSDALSPWFAPAGRRVRRWSLRLAPDEVAALVGMGPSARHPARAAAAAVAPATVDPAAPVTVTAAVQVSVWRPRP